jgi:hypothetical protein
LTKLGLGNILGDYLKNSSGHPACPRDGYLSHFSNSNEVSVSVSVGGLVGDRCYDLKKYFRRKIWRKILAFFAQTAATFCKI